MIAIFKKPQSAPTTAGTGGAVHPALPTMPRRVWAWLDRFGYGYAVRSTAPQSTAPQGTAPQGTAAGAELLVPAQVQGTLAAQKRAAQIATVKAIISKLRAEPATEGIFRISGRQSFVREALAQVEAGQPATLTDASIPDLCSLLKQMKFPFVPYNHYAKGRPIADANMAGMVASFVELVTAVAQHRQCGSRLDLDNLSRLLLSCFEAPNQRARQMMGKAARGLKLMDEVAYVRFDAATELEHAAAILRYLKPFEKPELAPLLPSSPVPSGCQ